MEFLVIHASCSFLSNRCIQVFYQHMSSHSGISSTSDRNSQLFLSLWPGHLTLMTATQHFTRSEIAAATKGDGFDLRQATWKVASGSFSCEKLFVKQKTTVKTALFKTAGEKNCVKYRWTRTYPSKSALITQQMTSPSCFMYQAHFKPAFSHLWLLQKHRGSIWTQVTSFKNPQAMTPLAQACVVCCQSTNGRPVRVFLPSPRCTQREEWRLCVTAIALQPCSFLHVFRSRLLQQTQP